MPISNLIGVEALSALLDNAEPSKRPIIFDCRFNLMRPDSGIEAWREGHIPGAYYAHLDDDLAGPITPQSGRHPLPGPDAFSDWLDAHGVHPGRLVVAYDGGPGAIAARLWWMLRWLGHHEVAVLDGGWKAWTGVGMPVDNAVPELVDHPPKTVRKADDSLWLTTEQLEDSLDKVRLVDARSPERFAGHEEPIDTKAGHIPGAVNADFTGNLRDDGRFLAPAALHERFSRIAGSQDGSGVVHSCGSGVTACHNLLAMELAGIEGSRLYAGSWSEWIADDSRPIETE